MSTDTSSVDVISTVLEALAGGSSDVTIIVISAPEPSEGTPEEERQDLLEENPYADFMMHDPFDLSMVAGGSGGGTSQPALLLE